MRFIIRVSLAVVVTAGLFVRAGAQAGPYSQTGDILIGGPLPAQWDYLAVDGANKRLYVSHNAEFVVIDMVTEKVLGRIAETPGAHGIAFTPDGIGFTTNGREGKSSMVDLKTMTVKGKVDVGPGPDAILYEPKNKEIYAMNHAAGKTTIVRADTGAMVTEIKLSGDATETGQADPALGRVFINSEGASVVDAVDVATHKLVGSWSVAPGSGPTGMAIDLAAHRLFVGAGSHMVMMDATTGKVVASVPICSGTDATFYDPGTKLAFSSCRDGNITVAHVDGPDKMTVVQTIKTATGSKTMALDPVTHKLYVGGAKPMAADPNAPAPAGRGRGPQMDPNSFHVFVFSMGK